MKTIASLTWKELVTDFDT